jgi:hypothetical protein
MTHCPTLWYTALHSTARGLVLIRRKEMGDNLYFSYIFIHWQHLFYSLNSSFTESSAALLKISQKREFSGYTFISNTRLIDFRSG